jgi:hypothetical protein
MSKIYPNVPKTRRQETAMSLFVPVKTRGHLNALAARWTSPAIFRLAMNPRKNTSSSASEGPIDQWEMFFPLEGTGPEFKAGVRTFLPNNEKTLTGTPW